MKFEYVSLYFHFVFEFLLVELWEQEHISGQQGHAVNDVHLSLYYTNITKFGICFHTINQDNNASYIAVLANNACVACLWTFPKFRIAWIHQNQ